MKHRYFSYFFWTIISWAVSFLFFVFRFEVNIFSSRHWSLLLAHFDRVPFSFLLSFFGFMVLWIGGGFSMRYFFKTIDRREEAKPYHSPSFAHDHSDRPVAVGNGGYVPQKGHYDGKKAKPIVREAPATETPKKPRLSDLALEAPVKKVETPKPVEAPKKSAVDLDKFFHKGNIKWLPTPKIGDLQLDYFGATDDAVFLFSVVKNPTTKMMFAEDGADVHWMNAEKERVDSPLALMAGVRKSFMGMCKKAFKNHVPFKVKTGLLFTEPVHDQLLVLKDKYVDLDLFTLDGKKLPSVDTILSEKSDLPSAEFIEFLSSVAHYFDKRYTIIPADSSDTDEEA